MGNIVEGVIEYMELKGETKLVELSNGVQWELEVCCDRPGSFDCCSQPNIVIDSMNCNYCGTMMEKIQGYHLCPGCNQCLDEKDIIKGGIVK